MRETTLCYLEKDGAYLMLYRNKKENDCNAGKWIGVGGKLEPGETPDECVVREVFEETGLTIKAFRFRGKVFFFSDEWEDEVMYLYTSEDFAGELMTDCPEGELKWIPVDEIGQLSLWDGDRIFLKQLAENRANIELELHYQKDSLVLVKDKSAGTESRLG